MSMLKPKIKLQRVATPNLRLKLKVGGRDVKVKVDVAMEAEEVKAVQEVVVVQEPWDPGECVAGERMENALHG